MCALKVVFNHLPNYLNQQRYLHYASGRLTGAGFSEEWHVERTGVGGEVAGEGEGEGEGEGGEREGEGGGGERCTGEATCT